MHQSCSGADDFSVVEGKWGVKYLWGGTVCGGLLDRCLLLTDPTWGYMCVSLRLPMESGG